MTTHTDDQAMANYLRAMGISVHRDNTVTLYHATPAKQQILKEGIVRGTTGKNVGVQLVENAAWFTPFRDVLSFWNAGGAYQTVTVRVPARFIRHTPQSNEIYFEGGLKRRASGLWTPVKPPKETFVIKIARRDYGKK